MPPVATPAGDERGRDLVSDVAEAGRSPGVWVPGGCRVSLKAARSGRFSHMPHLAARAWRGVPRSSWQHPGPITVASDTRKRPREVPLWAFRRFTNRTYAPISSRRQARRLWWVLHYPDSLRGSEAPTTIPRTQGRRQRPAQPGHTPPNRAGRGTLTLSWSAAWHLCCGQAPLLRPGTRPAARANDTDAAWVPSGQQQRHIDAAEVSSAPPAKLASKISRTARTAGSTQPSRCRSRTRSDPGSGRLGQFRSGLLIDVARHPYK